MADVVYKATLDDKEVLEALRRIEKKIDQTAKNGQKSFDGVGGGAGKAGLAIGAMSGLVSSLTTALINLGVQAAEAFANIVVSSVKAAAETEQITIALTSIFEGNKEAAEAFIGTMDTLAAKLGANQAEIRMIGKSILPDVGDIDTVSKLLENRS